MSLPVKTRNRPLSLEKKDIAFIDYNQSYGETLYKKQQNFSENTRKRNTFERKRIMKRPLCA